MNIGSVCVSAYSCADWYSLIILDTSESVMTIKWANYQALH